MSTNVNNISKDEDEFEIKPKFADMSGIFLIATTN